MNRKRSSFSGKLGFVLSAAGASVGLGNIWRFPYLAAKYGGGIFLLVYIILALTFGYTMIVAETALGRMTKKSPVGAYVGENSVFTLDTAQIKGVDSTVRETLVEMDKNSRLYVTERLMTEGDQTAESNIEVRLNGEDSSAQIISRSVGKGNSVQTFHPKAVGNNKCQAHIQCDSIIMDHAEIGSIPEIRARDLNAAIIHEAAIGRINDEQLLKLRTLGLTEEEAENVIIENFLN